MFKLAARVSTKQTELDHNGIITGRRQLVRHITQEEYTQWPPRQKDRSSR